MNERELIIRKEYDRARYTFIAGIILLVMTALLLGIGIFGYFNAKGDLPHFNDILESDRKDRTGKMAYLDIYGCYSFASDGDRDYYIAYDDTYNYMISMDEEAYEDAAEKYENSDGLIRLTGFTVSIPEEAIPYAIESFNEDAGEDFLNEYNFADYFGDLCLAVRPEKKVFGFDGFLTVSGVFFIGSIFTLAIGLILLFTGRVRKNSFSALFDPADDRLLSEVCAEDAVWFDKIKTGLTRDHLVSINGSFDAIDYSDIFWAYITQHKTNLIRDYDYIHIADKNGRQYSFANSPTFIKKNRENTKDLHEQIFTMIRGKNPDVLIGYTQENMEAFQQLLRRNKEDQKGETQI